MNYKIIGIIYQNKFATTYYVVNDKNYIRPVSYIYDWGKFNVTRLMLATMNKNEIEELQQFIKQAINNTYPILSTTQEYKIIFGNNYDEYYESAIGIDDAMEQAFEFSLFFDKVIVKDNDIIIWQK